MMVVIAVDPMSLNSIALIVTVLVSTNLKIRFLKMYLMYRYIFCDQSNNVSNLNASFFQTFNVKYLRTVIIMESVMVQENVYAMMVGNQKQTALVIILN